MLRLGHWGREGGRGRVSLGLGCEECKGTQLFSRRATSGERRERIPSGRSMFALYSPVTKQIWKDVREAGEKERAKKGERERYLSNRRLILFPWKTHRATPSA